MTRRQPDRNLALDLARVTEAAALASARWLGLGNKEDGDGAAVDAMRISFNAMAINGRVVIGEGEKDEAPMLYNGESVGSGVGPRMDIAVDPVEGTRLLAHGRPNAISVVAMTPEGSMYSPGPAFYMKKLVVPPEAAGMVDIEEPVERTLRKVAQSLNKEVRDLVVFVLDKERHQDLIADIRTAGARIQLHTDGDVAGALMAVIPDTGIDVMMGTGGTPEGVLAAVAIRVLGGEMQAMLDPQSEMERERVLEDGRDLKQVLKMDDLVSSDDIFFAATGITDGVFLKGVDFTGKGAKTTSLVMRGLTGTVRKIESSHRFDKLMRISSIDYD
ncbi:MAG: class II fructose-bisphosphatase [Pseudodesulfovibrio sp.]|uniref:Fructose-1,6-bisphosphatase n=1 Tax=Pseudodesulfovibrio aespoeensis (strain ATCC 700646 / DSM 10631 / Aspo-2) TaxID=643562 RepID=E6VVI8_PSEA9|nr:MULTISPECIES: class II fructose-bisphosphatase [Pseudodesulfovibrio]ADU63546.1 fructose-1,6-bisphosphatase, class II [Pseudodesulfovibrio aespoeensis Aspo-2]MBV1772169.1 class II fructose-bisphosphatase [Pseudodesulfovibrio sp.]